MGRVVANDPEKCHLEGARIAFRAEWVTDQWTFTVRAHNDDGWQTVLISQPACPADSDVEITGPVFQQAIARDRDSATAELLLIGQFGRRHFSGAITVTDTEIQIEMADRWIVPLPLPELRWEWQLPAGAAVTPKEHQLAIAGLVTLSIGEAKRESPRQASEPFALTAAVTGSQLRLRHRFQELPLPPGTMQYGCRISVVCPLE